MVSIAAPPRSRRGSRSPEAAGTAFPRYVKLFHDKNYESVLEGEIIETGVGIVLRKKMSHLGELFIFKSKKKK